jgi:hypothetical protein
MMVFDIFLLSKNSIDVVNMLICKAEVLQPTETSNVHDAYHAMVCTLALRWIEQPLCMRHSSILVRTIWPISGIVAAL